MQLIDFTSNIRDFTGEIDLVAQDLARRGVRAQRVQRTRHDRGILFLVVEDCKGRGGHGGEEERQRYHPRLGGLDGGQGAVWAAFHEGPGVWFWRGDEGAAV